MVLNIEKGRRFIASFSGGSPIIDVERINDALYVEVCGGVSMDVFVNLDHQGIR